ncbi:MAG: RagB/SusD family nutrient uptake outer membrane protein [Tannerellaceae bacterium]|nr:RagB/SusD family nutrient uptake outer membrane protein [Tannerellaceae bacterium]
MKQLYYVLIVCSFLLIGACDDFLDQPQKGVMTEDIYYNTPDAGLKAVVKCYLALNDFYGYEAPRAELGNMATDDSEKGGSDAGDRPFAADISFGRPLSSNTSLANYWEVLYTKGIANCNICLEDIPVQAIIDANGYPVTEEVKARYLAEVKFLRAFYYFELVKIFGGVPIVDRTLTVNDANKLARATENETFLFIMKDLDEAAAEIHLPTISALPATELGRVTQEAVWSMQARVYLYFAKDDNSLYAKARDAAKKVIDSPSCTLAPQFQLLYQKDNYKLAESIFPNIRGDNPTANIYGSFIPLFCSPRGPSGAWGFDQPTQNLVDEFEEGDPRLLFTVLVPGDKFPKSSGTEELNFSSYPSTGYHSRKAYLVESRRGPGWGDDAWSFHIIRYADVLLMYAEALLQSGGDKQEVANRINEVRERANNSRQEDAEAISRGITIPNVPLKPVTVSDDLFEAIKHERRVELAMEYNRLYDLKRWNIYIETMNAFSSLPYSNGRGAAFQKGVNELFPIPQVEIDRSQGSIKQNPGYN